MSAPLVDQVKLSVPVAASKLGVSRYTVYRLIHAGKLPAFRIGQRILVCLDDLDALIQNSRVSA